MSDVLYAVRTVYETDTSAAASGMSSLSGIALRLGGVLDTVKGVASRVFDAAVQGGIAAGLAGVAALVVGMHHLNGELDSTSVGIAGMVSAAEVEGTEGVTGWANSMAFAEGSMEQIRRDAAALPGQAEDFVEVFRAGLAPALEAGMRAADVSQFTNRFAAVGIAFRVDAPQIGRDLNLMLQGRAGAQVNMWNRLKSTIGMTAKEFNALSAAQRQAKIDDALKRYQPMIDAYANTWEAITSTTVSYGKDLLRLATNPFFHVAKKELRSMNDWWGQNEKGIREYANGVGTLLVGAYKTARREAGVYFDRVDAFVRSDTAQRLWSFGERAASMASNLAGRAWGAVTESPGATASGVGMAAGVAMGIPGLGLVLGGLVQFATHTEAADAVMSSLGDTAGSVAAILGTLWPLFEQVEVGLGDVFASLLPGLAAGLAGAAEGLQQFIAEAGPGVGELIDAVRPIVEMLGGILGELAREIGTDTIERLHDLGVGIGALASVIAELIASLQLREAPALGTLRNAPRDGAHGQGIAERLNTFLERIRQPLTAQQRAELGARGGARREVGHPGRTVVNVQIHQTVNTNDDPDRVLLMTRRAVYQGLHAPLQSPGVRVTH